MEEEYIAWFKDGSTIKKNTLNEAVKLSYFEYIIRAIPLNKCSKGYMKFRYEFLDKDTNPVKISVNNYVLIDIVENDYNSYDKELIYYDTNRKVTFKKKINGSFEYVFSKWVVDFLNKIDDLGGFEIYKIIEENEKLKKEIESIEKITSKKREVIEKLEKEIEELKEKIREED